MNVGVLKEGQTFKNYKELCKLLKLTPMSGKARQLQFKELERHVKIKKQGHSITIEEKYEMPLDKIDKRTNNKGGNNSAFMEVSEKILIHMMANAPIVDGSSRIITITKTSLFEALGYVNENYRIGSHNQQATSEVVGVSPHSTKFFFDNMYTKSSDRVERLLKSLKPGIAYSTIKMICDANGNHRKPTNEEMEYIVDACDKVLHEELGLTRDSILFGTSYMHYLKRVNHHLKQHGIQYAYEAYEIVLSTRFMSEVAERHAIMSSIGETIPVLQAQVSTLCQNSNNKSFTVKRGKLVKSKPKLGLHRTESDRYMSRKLFVSDGEKLFEVCGRLNPEMNLVEAFVEKSK